MRPKVFAYSCFIAVFIPAQANAQEEKSGMNCPELGAKVQYGYLMAHSTSMEYMVQGHNKSIEIYGEKVASGRKNWHHAYRSPTVGIAAHIMDFGNRINMGFAIAVIPYMKLHVVKRSHFELNSRLGSGLGYLTKSFNRIDNNKNSAIASPLNAAISMSLEPEWKTKYIDVGLGLNFMHFSNGAWKTPNMGFNLSGLSFSIGYKFNQKIPAFNKQKIFDAFVKQNTWEVYAVGGAKEVMPANGPKHAVFGTHVQYRRHYAVKSNFLAYADISYNGGYKAAYEFRKKKTVDDLQAVRAGVGIGYGVSFDRLMLSLNNGVYLLDPLHYDGVFYHQVAARYYFDNNMIASFSLNTHWATADVVEFGFGYVFKTVNKHTQNKVRE